MANDNFLGKKLEKRKQEGSFRNTGKKITGVDFSSNDYLGIVHNGLLGQNFNSEAFSHGSTGSRLLTGNSDFAEELESLIASFHGSEAALLFNSGYDANIGLISAIAGTDDFIIYDFLSHMSIRDGVRLSRAKSFSFLHNDVEDLERRLKSLPVSDQTTVFVVTESVFSMDGDYAPLQEIARLCELYNAHLVIDEAHATGIVGSDGGGLVSHCDLVGRVFARVHTFGKALGCHGAVVTGTRQLKEFLVNFSRPFIYTTALPMSALAVIKNSYEIFPSLHRERAHLAKLIKLFQQTETGFTKLVSPSPIQAIIVPGNKEVKTLSSVLHERGFDARPILYPTVPAGSERIRIVLHSFNTIEETTELLRHLV